MPVKDNVPDALLQNLGLTPHEINVVRSLKDKAQKYSTVRLNNNFANQANSGGQFAEQLIQIPGDHIYVATLENAASLYIKLQDDRNPYIRVTQGDTITRNFTRFKARFSGAQSAYGSTGAFAFDVALLYVSDGPLIHRQFKRTGFGNGTFTGRGFIASTVKKYIFTDILGANFLACSTGLFGGTLMI
jgi:hypothetical protein